MATSLCAQTGDAVFEQVEAYLDAAQRKSLLRVLTCGSVDDGKSTLLGRLLYDSKTILDDQLAALEGDSRKWGTQGDGLDFALLVDGLSAEREQGITIDVAYRFFATDKRKFIVADTPGHEQYTRNMVTGASTADLAIILVDARKGLMAQTRRHSTIAHLLGIRDVVLAINKMDLVDFAQDRFDTIIADYRVFADEIGIEDFTAIPLSALTGDNIAAPSRRTPWYHGRALLDHLERVQVGGEDPKVDEFHFPVQWVNRPDSGFRGYAGRIAGGTVRPGDAVRVLPSGQSSTVERIVTMDGDLARGLNGQSVTLTLADEIDCSRGEVIVAAKARLQSGRRLSATLVWMAEAGLVPGRSYWLKIGTAIVSATIANIGHVLDVDNGRAGEARPLALNDIGQVELSLDRPVAARPYGEDRELGAFILIDKLDRSTVAAGMIDSIIHDEVRRDRETIYWLSDPGDAEHARRRLQQAGRPSFVLDDTTLAEFADPDAAEFIRRARAVALLMSRAGINVVMALPAAPDERWPGQVYADESQDSDAWVI
ncbi:MAG: sulfate adenylyltransferase subunit CysN [Sphingomicrobium sp.]|nr:sulfate adenylyltransferase subunit CysN [Sphingomonadales bacterium]